MTEENKTIWMDHIEMKEEVTGKATASFMYKLIMNFPKEKEYLQFPGDFQKIPDEMRELLDGIDVQDLYFVRSASTGLWPDFVVTGIEEVSSIYRPPAGDQPGEQHEEVKVFVTKTPTKEQCMKSWGSNLDFTKEHGPYPTETMFTLIKSKIFTITNEGRKIKPALYAKGKDIARYLQPIWNDIAAATQADEPTERERNFLLMNEAARLFNPYIHALMKEPELATRPIEELINVTLDYFMEKTETPSDTLIQEGRKRDILNHEVLSKNFRFFYPCEKSDLAPFIKYVREKLGAAATPGRRTVMPDNYLAETDKGAAKIFDGSLYKLEPGQKGIIDLARYNAKKPIQRFISIDSDQIPQEILKRKLSSFDWLIHDAINSTYQAGNEYMTINTIANVITGKDSSSNYNPSQSLKKEIEDSIKALISTSIIMDFSQEAQAYKAGFDYRNGKTYQYRGNVIHGEIVTEKVNGQLSEGVLHVLREPILFSLARKKEQIATIPIKVLNSPIAMTKGAFELRDYLMRRIERMRPTDGKPKDLKQRTILLSSMYDAVGAAQKQWNQKQRLLNMTIKFLDDWRNENYICDYAVDNERIFIAISKPQKGESERIQQQSFFKLIDKKDRK